MSEFKAGMDWNEEQPLDDYRTISRAAVVSLALTLLALLAFASPVLWIVPVLSGFRHPDGPTRGNTHRP